VSGLSDDIDALVENKEFNRKTCNVMRVIRQVELEQGVDVADKVRKIVEDNNYSGNRVIAVLRKNGYRLGRESLMRHRKRGNSDGCVCAP